MKIAMINTSDQRGGAAVAASRLKEALTRKGIGVKLIVRDKISGDPDVISVDTGWFRRKLNRFRFLWERGVIFLHNGFSRGKLFAVSIADTGADLSRRPEVREADVIHLHWVNQGLLSLRGLKKLLALGKPVVWTLHDMWPVTGICHHAWGCGRYETRCGVCPFLDSTRQKDLSTRVFRRKQKIYDCFPGLTLVPVSRWLDGKCRASVLTAGLRTQVIPNTIDAERFSPGDKIAAREKSGISAGKKVIAMGAARIDDPVKGFSLLKEALAKLSPETKEQTTLLLFGGLKDETVLEDVPVPVVWLGTVDDPARLPEIYRAADVAVSSSHYETFGQTISEAMACGCPAVGFDNSGPCDIIDHHQNGWLARYPDAQDLARGIEWVLNHSDPATLAENARQKILDRFTIDRVAEQYIELYNSLLK